MHTLDCHLLFLSYLCWCSFVWPAVNNNSARVHAIDLMNYRGVHRINKISIPKCDKHTYILFFLKILVHFEYCHSWNIAALSGKSFQWIPPPEILLQGKGSYVFAHAIFICTIGCKAAPLSHQIVTANRALKENFAMARFQGNTYKHKMRC